ncbi:monooxygenase [Aeromicrobium sp. Root495]|uniref:cytochrome P450 n=1 Tax=Aeromicrobium sp. Root495 TaxID=1736550 RepID=UPI0006F41250|nr:cytochrome P450 [Aeromicrobium sp. Root495]KQY59865.1 monooxygenase [Aeromicrobium sp. Root495]
MKVHDVRYEHDLYSDAAIGDPYPHYAALRELGPAVWLTAHRCFAVARYADAREVLTDDVTFASGEGVGLNPVVNRLSRGTTLNSDGDEHAARRRLLAHRLTPRALRSMADDVASQAEAVVAAAVATGEVDGVRDLAQALPLSIVPDLVGWPESGRQHLLRWAGATFDALGPLNARSARATPAALGMMRFSRKVVRERSTLPGSMGSDVLAAADRGELDRSACPALMIDYLAPSLDTTISAISSALVLLARHPQQWDLLRADPSLVPNAVNEVVRLESPLRAFSRVATTSTKVGGQPVPAGSRVLVLYASANRDEREWDRPTELDVTRDASRQLGFGYGTHGCAGQGLARLETQSLLTALLRRVERLELTGDPVPAMNNIIKGWSSVPLRLVPDERRTDA